MGKSTKGNKMQQNQHLTASPDALPDWGEIRRIDPEFHDSRFRAVVDGKNTFLATCPNCLAEKPHDVRYATCLACHPRSFRPLRENEDENRAAARRVGAKQYASHCERCGPEGFYVKTGQCSRCYTTNGTRRCGLPFPPERRLALDRGDPTYTAACLLHGTTEHHTRRGLCLGCYDTQGKPRDEVYMRYCRRHREFTVHSAVTGSCMGH